MVPQTPGQGDGEGSKELALPAREQLGASGMTVTELVPKRQVSGSVNETRSGRWGLQK